MTLREKVKEQIVELAELYYEEWCEANHTSETCQWIEVYPDGDVNEAEEADSNTTHWIEYPTKQVAVLMGITNSSSRYCNCEVCHMLKQLEEYRNGYISEEEFEEYTDCKVEDVDGKSLYELLEDYDMALSAQDYIDDMLDALGAIEYGYFDDEEE